MAGIADMTRHAAVQVIHLFMTISILLSTSIHQKISRAGQRSVADVFPDLDRIAGHRTAGVDLEDVASIAAL
jgi:hypothetical protein